MPMREALTLLHTLYPAQGLVYVGAGNGDFLEQVVLPPAPALLAIEADEALYTQLAAKIEQHPQGQALHQLVGDQDEAVSFYRHSSPKENGLLSATLLMPLWKNLRLREAITTPAQTLHSILANTGEGSPRYNWLTLACLPALPLLQGLGPTLQQFDVLQARVALTDDAALAEAGASRPAVDAWLQTQGFKPLLVQEETHAQLASVFYARDWKTQAAQTSQALTLAHQSKIEALQQEKTALAQAHEQQSKLAAERQVRIEALDKEKTELVAVRDAFNQEKSALIQARDTQSKLATERQAKIATLDKEKAELIAAHDALGQEKSALIQARDAQSKLAVERQAKIEALDKDKAELVAARDALSQEKAALTQARDAQSKLAAERQAKIGALDKEKAVLTAACDSLIQEKNTLFGQSKNEQQRIVALEEKIKQAEVQQHCMNDELTKAEKQLNFIKKFLLESSSA